MILQEYKMFIKSLYCFRYFIEPKVIYNDDCQDFVLNFKNTSVIPIILYLKTINFDSVELYFQRIKETNNNFCFHEELKLKLKEIMR